MQKYILVVNGVVEKNIAGVIEYTVEGWIDYLRTQYKVVEQYQNELNYIIMFASMHGVCDYITMMTNSGQINVRLFATR